MKSFPRDKYKFYIVGTKVIAVSSYGGRKVKGVANCHPEDNFDLEYGKDLAAARCNAKVAAKRLKRATKKLFEAKDMIVDVTNHANKMYEYYVDSEQAAKDAEEELRRLAERIK